jgi:hypothetical protein
MTTWYWSVVLAGFGLIGLYLAGRNSYWGWALGLVDEVLWTIYAITTRQWAFCLSAMAYGWVYSRNLRAWLTIGRMSQLATLSGEPDQISAQDLNWPDGGPRGMVADIILDLADTDVDDAPGGMEVA